MLSKVCGLFDPDNIAQVAAENPDYIGCILYPSSPRHINEARLPTIRAIVPKHIKLVAVFVNETSSVMLEHIKKYAFDAVQLHGETMHQEAQNLRAAQFQGDIFLAVPSSLIHTAATFSPEDISFLLFDSPTPLHGGSGISFDWSALTAYQGNIPFFLSGGIGPHNIDEALHLRHKHLKGIDMNSRLENPDYTKNIAKVSTCLKAVRAYEA